MPERELDTSGWADGISRAAHRLVHPDVTGDDRQVHARFLGVAFAAPLLAPLVAVPAAGQDVGAILAWTFAALAFSWSAALLLIATGRLVAAGAVLTLGGSTFLGGAIAYSGIPASPMLLLFLLLPVEAFWVVRRPAPVRWASMLAIAGATGVIVADPGATTAGSLLLHWIAPAVWFVAVWFRRDDFRDAAKSPDVAGVAVENLIDAVVLQFDPGGPVVSASDATGAMLGLPPGFLLGSGLFDRVLVADRVGYLSALAELRDGAPRRDLRLRLRAPAAPPGDGSGYLDVELTIGRATDGAGLVGVLRLASFALEPRTVAPAAEDDRLEIAKSRFLAAVSHELRTPLNAIIGFSDMLLHELFGPFADPRQREYVALISESGSHLLGVVNAILDVSKIEAGAYSVSAEPFAFADAVDMSVSMVARQAETKGIVIASEIERDAELFADRRAIQQILINLLSNAVKFTPNGGKVTISTEHRPGIFEFAVSDTGIGISDENLSKLGRPFMQIENDLSRSYDGAGLGLSLVKGLVELHKGRMSIESAPGLGTTVRIGIPDSVTGAARRIKNKEGKHHDALRKTG